MIRPCLTHITFKILELQNRKTKWKHMKHVSVIHEVSICDYLKKVGFGVIVLCSMSVLVCLLLIGILENDVLRHLYF